MGIPGHTSRSRPNTTAAPASGPSGAVQLDRSLTRVELFSDRGSLRWDTADIDHDECWPVLRAEFAAAVRHGAPVTADVSRGLQLQLLDAIERSLADRVRVPIGTD